MEFLLFCMFVLLFIAWYLSCIYYEKQLNQLKKQNRKLRSDIKKIKNNEYYIFDYLTGIYEDLERGKYEERKES